MQSRLTKVIGLGTLTCLLASCSGFTGVTGEKAKKVLGRSVFATATEERCMEDGVETLCPETVQPEPVPEAPPPAPPSPPMETPAGAICSNDGVAHNGGSVQDAMDLKTLLVNDAGATVCDASDASIKTKLVNEKMLVVKEIDKKCPTLAEGEYTLQLRSGTSKNLLSGTPISSVSQQGYLNIPQAYFDFYYGAATNYRVKVTKENGTMKLAPASQGGPSMLLSVNPGGYNNTGPTGSCDFAGSPLLVQINKAGRAPAPISLTAPLDGVLFDILGERSFPQAHSKKKISWFAPQASSGNYFLVLPNANGEVKGINEMFGDNTKGPDGQFAANGYEALRKHDGRKADGSIDQDARDGEITRKDAIFSQLRLWADENGDAVAQASELKTLSELKVTSINLSYDASYSEKDKFGNEIKMKSFIETSDGAVHLMYDLWFRIID